MSINIKEQSTCEGCLAVCLIHLLKSKNINLSDEEEHNILFEGLKFTRIDFSTGHLVYLAKKFPEIKFEQHIDFFEFHTELSKLKIPENLKLHYNKINFKFIKNSLEKGPLIIYLDGYTLERNHHYPHFVILDYFDKGIAIIHNPWVGKKIKIKTSVLMKSIFSLRNLIKISPKLIRII